MKAFKFELKKEFKKRQNIFIFIGVICYFIGILFYMNFADIKHRTKLLDLAVQKEQIVKTERTYRESSLRGNEAKKRLDSRLKHSQEEDEDAGYFDSLSYASEETIESIRDAYDKFTNTLGDSLLSEGQIKEELNIFKSINSKAMVETHFYDKYKRGEKMTDHDLSSMLLAAKGTREYLINGFEDGSLDPLWLEDSGFDIPQLKREYLVYDEISKRDVVYEINPYEKSFKNYLKMLFSPMNLFVILLFLAIISIESFMSEFDDGSFKTIYSSPFKRNDMLMAKYAAKSISNIVILLVPAFIVSILVLIFYGKGNLDYPEMISSSLTSFNLLIRQDSNIFITSRKLLMIYGLQFLLIIVFHTIVSIAIAVIFNDGDVSFASILLFMIIAYMGIIFEHRANFLRLINPWSYIDIPRGFDSMYRTNFYYGFLLQLVFVIVLTIISKYRFKNRDLS